MLINVARVYGRKSLQRACEILNMILIRRHDLGFLLLGLLWVIMNFYLQFKLPNIFYTTYIFYMFIDTLCM